MRPFLHWVQQFAARAAAGSAPPQRLRPEESVPCRACDGSGLCRVCSGLGTTEQLVAVAGADGGGLMAEPTQQMKTVKCRACPRGSGSCKACQGQGRVRIV